MFFHFTAGGAKVFVVCRRTTLTPQHSPPSFATSPKLMSSALTSRRVGDLSFHDWLVVDFGDDEVLSVWIRCHRHLCSVSFLVLNSVLESSDCTLLPHYLNTDVDLADTATKRATCTLVTTTGESPYYWESTRRYSIPPLPITTATSASPVCRLSLYYNKVHPSLGSSVS